VDVDLYEQAPAPKMPLYPASVYLSIAEANRPRYDTGAPFGRPLTGSAATAG
jgi:hypothetical protein